MNRLFGIIILILATAQLQSQNPETMQVDNAQSILDDVNPFVGTGGHGHTFPGATFPFGMVQLSPDTRLTGWDGCSGYHYSDSIIFGFSHTHLSGTGVSDYGDILLMPVNNGDDLKESTLVYDDFKSSFDHISEHATAGYYEVLLDRPNVQVQLTTSPRVGVHQYEFLDPKSPAIVLDLEHRDKVLSCDFEVLDSTTIIGHRHSSTWATDQRLFFAIKFSEPFEDYNSLDFEDTDDYSKGLFLFPKNTKSLTVKVALSAVDKIGALNNFKKEVGGKDFETVRKETQQQWTNELGKIDAEFRDEEDREIFYSALYHCMIAPNLYSDIDGRYRGIDLEIHENTSEEHYTVFSLWDTYRAFHPLMTIIDQKRTNSFINSMLTKYQEGGILPIWDLSSCYTGCMIGYHGVSAIADAYVKGIRGYDEELAFASIKHSAEQNHLGLDEYKKNGFISVEHESESVSKTLEYAYDDWCIAQMAKTMGKDELANGYAMRSLHYRNLFDPETHFFRPRLRNKWLTPFDPFEVNNNYTEANAWQYGFAPVHDMSGFMEMHGGKNALEQRLDSLFSASSSTSGRQQADITGLIGQYAHGNEPSHHIAYLYNYAGAPWKTQQRVREILETQYQNAPNGISGNEDCGQMSAWYVLSALGFYSVLPGSDYYVIGSPLVKEASINLENGKSFVINTVAENNDDLYIQAVILNGANYSKSYLRHADIMKGGQMVVVLGPSPNKNWGNQEKDMPHSKVEDEGFVLAPFISEGEFSFIDQNEVKLATADSEYTIFYQLDVGDFTQYQSGESIVMDESGTICAYAMKDELQSATICTEFFKRDKNVSLQLNSKYSTMYHAGGDDAVIDGLRGGKDHRTGTWQGYSGQDFEAIVDIGEGKQVEEVAAGFLQEENSWIFYPKEVLFYGSVDGESYELLGTDFPDHSPKEGGVLQQEFSTTTSKKIRYIKVHAKSLLKCPEWHKGYEYDGNAWIFVDEITIR